MLPPLPRCSNWVYSSLISPSRVSLPRFHYRVGLHIVLFEVCSAFTRVAACTLARSPIRDQLSEGFRHFVSSMPAPVASGWSESPGGPCTHWKAPPCHGARGKAALRITGAADARAQDKRLAQTGDRPHFAVGCCAAAVAKCVPRKVRTRTSASLAAAPLYSIQWPNTWRPGCNCTTSNAWWAPG